MTFLPPSWRSLNHLKGSLNHPKNVTLNHLVLFPSFLGVLAVERDEKEIKESWSY